MTEHCEYKLTIEAMRQDISDIKKDVRSLLAFKWRAAGAGIALGIIGGFMSFLGTILAFIKGVK